MIQHCADAALVGSCCAWSNLAQKPSTIAVE
jgi:hypothetical protein